MNPLGYLLVGVCSTLGIELLICLYVGWRMTRDQSKDTIHQDWLKVRESIRRRAEQGQRN
jgi:hypothetical protein